MPTIVIRIDPEALADPDLDLRYEIPDLLEQRSHGTLSDRGYTHEWDTDSLLLFLETSDLATALPHVIALLEHDRLHGNDLAGAALVGVSTLDPLEADELAVVYPAGHRAVIRRVSGIAERAFTTVAASDADV